MTDPDDTRIDSRIALLLIESLDAELGARLESPPALDAPPTLDIGPVSDARSDRRGSRDRPAPSHRRRVWAPIAASVAVAAAVVGTALAVNSEPSDHTSSGVGTGTPRVRVSCISAGGDVEADRVPLTRRAEALAHGGQVDTRVAGRTISVTIPGTTRGAAGGLCTSNTLFVRPLVAPVVKHIGTTGSLKDLGFPAPATEVQYDRLTPKQQVRLATKLARVPCLTQDSSTVPTAACLYGSDYGGVVTALLGAPILGPGAVADAQAQPPGVAHGGAEWTVRITLDKAGARALLKYTSKYNSANSSTGTALRCGSASGGASSTPCSDYIAFGVDGAIATLPITQSPTGKTTQIAGNFTKASAEKLAALLRTGPLPTPLRTFSVKAVH